MKTMENSTLKFDVDSKIGDYTLLAPCGRGAYGFVFLAENSVTHQRVALKIVYTHGKNFERELKGLQQYQQICRRTNLLQIYHVGSGDDFFYYTMDAADSMSESAYCPKTLANLLKERGKQKRSIWTGNSLDNRIWMMAQLLQLWKTAVFSRIFPFRGVMNHILTRWVLDFTDVLNLTGVIIETP